MYIARGFIIQFYLSLDQNFIDEENYNLALNQIQICKKLLNGFINYYKKLRERLKTKNIKKIEKKICLIN